MDNWAVIERAGQLLWKYKPLAAPGIAIAIAGGVEGLLRPLLAFGMRRLPPGVTRRLPLPPGFDPSEPGVARAIRWLLVEAYRLGPPGWVGLAAAAVVVLIILGLILILARGALIAAASEADTGNQPAAGAALALAWRRAWRLIVIASIPAIPVTVAAIVVVLLAVAVVSRVGAVELMEGPQALQRRVLSGLGLASVILLCPFMAITVALGMLRHLADRACMLEDSGVLESYRRGWRAARANSGSALILLGFTLAAQTALGSAIGLIRGLAVICAAGLPLLWLINGTMRAYFIILWTLAWRSWVSAPEADPSLPSP